MGCLKKSLSLLLAVAVGIVSAIAYLPSTANIVNAASAKYEYISFAVKEEHSINFNTEVKNGDYYLRVIGEDYRNYKIQIKNGTSGKYKTTKINTQPRYGFVGNGKFLYYIEKTSKNNVLKRYNYKTGKIEKIKKLPVSENINNKNIEGEECEILGVCGDYIFITCYNDIAVPEGTVIYSFNIKNKKIKRSGLENHGNELTNGKYLVVENAPRTDFRARAFDIYKLKNDGTVKKIKRVTKKAMAVTLYNDTIYWVSISKDESAANSKNVLYSMKINGSGKKTLFKANKKKPLYYTGFADDKGVVVNCDGGKLYKYSFKTKKLTRYKSSY